VARPAPLIGLDHNAHAGGRCLDGVVPLMKTNLYTPDPGGQEPRQGQQSHDVVIRFTAHRSNGRKNSYWRFPNQQSATPMVVRSMVVC